MTNFGPRPVRRLLRLATLLPLLYPLWAVSAVLWWSWPSGVARVTTNASGEFWLDVALVGGAASVWAYWAWWIAFRSGAWSK